VAHVRTVPPIFTTKTIGDEFHTFLAMLLLLLLPPVAGAGRVGGIAKWHRRDVAGEVAASAVLDNSCGGGARSFLLAAVSLAPTHTNTTAFSVPV